MGQYYHLMMCDEDGGNPIVVSPAAIDFNGLKLMEHSYYLNRVVEVACAQLLKSWRHQMPRRIWWVGDYAEENDIPTELRKYKPIELAWGKDAKTTVLNEEFDFEDKLYLLNLDTHEYIDLLRVRELNKVEGWSGSIHPLPLLTAVGNGGGGGDYHSGSNMNMVGLWAGNLLQILPEVPKDDFLAWVDVSDDVRFVEER